MRNGELFIELPGNGTGLIELAESASTEDFYPLDRIGFSAGETFGAHLKVTLSNDTSFLVDLEGVTTVADAIEKAVRANAGLIAEIIADPDAAVGEDDDDGGAPMAASGK